MPESSLREHELDSDQQQAFAKSFTLPPYEPDTAAYEVDESRNPYRPTEFREASMMLARSRKIHREDRSRPYATLGGTLMYLRRSISAAIFTGAVAIGLAACGGGVSSSASGTAMVPAAVVQHARQARRWTIVNAHPSRTPQCNTGRFNSGCYTFSQANGLVVDWCFGPPSNPCADTGNYTNYGGRVYHISDGATVSRITVTWSGPTQCDPTHCQGSNSGTYIEDAMEPGKNPPGIEKRYGKEQDWVPCVGYYCGDERTIGIDVGRSVTSSTNPNATPEGSRADVSVVRDIKTGTL